MFTFAYVVSVAYALLYNMYTFYIECVSTRVSDVRLCGLCGVGDV